MDTLRLVDVGVFFTFLFTPFCSASFLLFFGGGPCDFFCRIAPLRQPFGPHKIFWTFCEFLFFESFVGASVPLHS